LLVLIVAGAGAIGLLVIVSGSDAPGGGSVSGTGQEIPIVVPSSPPSSRANPPTSGPHAPASVTRDGAAISDDQLLDAIERGDVVLLYGGASPPPALRALAAQLAPPFSAALADAGGAVILARRQGTRGVIGVAYRHLVRVSNPADPALGQFVDYWLGRGQGNG
jgi:uncharacterized protein DUF3105